MKLLWALIVAAVAVLAGAAPALAEPLRFEVTFGPGVTKAPVTGRLLVVASNRATPEPRQLINLNGPPLFGVDVDQAAPGSTVTVGPDTVGFPVATPAALTPGDYQIQAVFIPYTRTRRSDGRELWVPAHHKVQIFSSLPGNLHSAVVAARLDPAKGGVVRLELNQVIAEDEAPKDTPWLKHIRIRSKLLSDFWGFPVYLSAKVLIPKGFDQEPKRRYPVVLLHGHGTPFFFDDDPKSHERRLAGARASELETGYEFYQSWTSDDFPRFVAATFEASTPFFADGYGVNSANNGPYGDAYVKELIPEIEKRFRGIGQPYARVLEGASTGGWTALAQQLYYPEFFGGVWVLNPDPVDFRNYGLVNIYEDKNAFEVPVSGWMKSERPMRRGSDGQVHYTMREISRFEAVMGSKGRAGYQLNAWEAVFAPPDKDGYPAALWDKLTGEIDPKVAVAMREGGYDLSDYTKRNWPTLGPKLEGKLNFITGDMDWFYLNLAVYRFEGMLKQTQNPHYEGRFIYGRPMKGHNWHHTTWAGMVREMAAQVKANTPAGAETARP